MLNDLIEIKDAEYNGRTADCHSAACLDEGLQHEQMKTYEHDDCREIIIIERDSIRYEIHGIYHTRDSVEWHHSRRRERISMEADATCEKSNILVFFEQGLLSCQKAAMLNDIKYALNILKTLKIDRQYTSQMQQDFINKMDSYFSATYNIIHTTLCNSKEALQENATSKINLFSKAILLPQPIGLESNLMYLDAYLKTNDINSPETQRIYVGFTPVRPAYMAKKLRDSAEYLENTTIQLYCGIGHTEEIAFLLRNPKYINRYLR